MRKGNTILMVGMIAVMALVVVGPTQGGTVAMFNMDILNGNTVLDVSGNGHDAGSFYYTLNQNDLDPFDLSASKSLALSGNDRGNLANPGTIDLKANGSSDFTLEGWIRPSIIQRSLIWFLQSTSTNSTLALEMYGNGRIRGQVYLQGAGQELYGNTVLTALQWTHVALVYHNSQYMEIYVNGISDGSVYVGRGVPTIQNWDVISFGGGTGQWLNGLLDDLRISDVELSPSQLGCNASFTGTEQMPILSVSPVRRDVVWRAGQTTFDVSNAGIGTMAWTAAVIDGGSWLTIDSGAGGTDNGTITVRFTQNDNATATRTGTIRVTAGGALASPKDVTVVQGVYPGDPMTGTVALFNMDILNWNSILDVSGNGHDAGSFYYTLNQNDLDPFDLSASKSLALSGNDRGNLANPGTIDLKANGSSDFTLEGWIRPSIIQRSLIWFLQSTSTNSSLTLEMYGNGRIRGQVYLEGAGQELYGNTVLTALQWTHVALVYHNSQYMEIYVNGVSDGSVYVGRGVPTTQNWNVVTLGGGTGQWLNGLLDDLRISNVERAPSELGYYRTFTGTERVPILSVSPARRDVVWQAGQATLDVSKTGIGTMAWTAAVTNGGSWLTIDSGAGGTDNGTITVRFTQNDNATATRTGTIRVTAVGALGSPKDVTVVQGTSRASAVAKYKLDRLAADSKTVLDITGNGHNGVFNREVSVDEDDPFTKDESRSVYTYIDTTQGTLTNPGTINLYAYGAKTFTLEGWIKPASWPAGLMQFSSSDGGTTVLALYIDGTGKAVAASYIQGGGWMLVFSLNTIPLNQWTHLAMIGDSAGYINLYVNGQYQGNAFQNRALPSTGSEFIMGYAQGYQLVGYLDDVGIYDDALAPEQLGYYASYTIPRTVYADDFGYGSADATEALQTAIDSEASTVIVRNMGTPWIIGAPITITNHFYMDIEFQNGVILEAKPDAFHGISDCLVKMSDAKHITLDGYGTTFKMRKQDYMNPDNYTFSEGRSTLALYSCQNITIQGLTLLDSGGDGIYIGYDGDSNIHIKDVVASNHYRQGMSVINVNGLLVENSVFSGTNGTAPQCGVDVEPNFAWQEIQDITLRNCVFANNVADGIVFSLAAIGGGGSTTGTLENCTFYGNSANGIHLKQAIPGLTLKDCLSVNNSNYGAKQDAGTPGILAYSAFWGNGLGAASGMTLGTGCLTGVQPLFASTNIASRSYMYLAGNCPSAILTGASDGGYMGARPQHKSGDVNYDGVVNGADLAAVLAAMDSTHVDTNWNADADIDVDGEVTSTDLSTVLADMP